VSEKATRGTRTGQQAVSALSTEGSATGTLGTVLIVLSIVSTCICVMAFGRIRIPSGLYGTQTVWSSTLVMAYVAAGLNGVLLGFVLQKVGSILRHLEQLRRAQ
jgi:hypothetical protein